MQIQCTIALASDSQTEGKVSVTPRSWLPFNNRKIYYNTFAASAEHLWSAIARDTKEYTWPTNWWI